MGCLDRVSPVSTRDCLIQGLPKAAALLATTVTIVALLIILVDFLNGLVYQNPTIFKPATVDFVWALAKWSGVAAVGCVAVSFIVTSCYTLKEAKGKPSDQSWAYFRLEMLRSFCFPCTICS